MGKKYRVRNKKGAHIDLTAMQSACYKYLKNNSGIHTIEEIVFGTYTCFRDTSCPDIWTHEEKIENVTKWCEGLVSLYLIENPETGSYSLDHKKVT